MDFLEELKEQFSQLHQEIKEQFKLINEQFDQIEKRLYSLEKHKKYTEIDIEFLAGKVGMNEMVLNRFK